jgi:hypothetical protein
MTIKIDAEKVFGWISLAFVMIAPFSSLILLI